VMALEHKKTKRPPAEAGVENPGGFCFVSNSGDSDYLRALEPEKGIRTIAPSSYLRVSDGVK
jgi:hypothetical protein